MFWLIAQAAAVRSGTAARAADDLGATTTACTSVAATSTNKRIDKGLTQLIKVKQLVEIDSAAAILYPTRL